MVEKKATAQKSKLEAKPKAPTKAVAPVAEKLLPHEVLTSPVLQNAIGVYSWGAFAGDPDLKGVADEIRNQAQTVVDGSMAQPEAMLYGQAMTLQTIFTSLAQRASTNTGLKQFQVHMTLALKAQAQCRATIEALALLKNPMPYIRQANITNGPQQVNNGVKHEQYPRAHTGARNFQGEQSKLLEADHGQRLDTRAAQAAGRANQAVGTVAAIHRAEVARG